MSDTHRLNSTVFTPSNFRYRSTIISQAGLGIHTPVSEDAYSSWPTLGSLWLMAMTINTYVALSLATLGAVVMANTMYGLARRLKLRNLRSPRALADLSSYRESHASIPVAAGAPPGADHSPDEWTSPIHALRFQAYVLQLLTDSWTVSFALSPVHNIFGRLRRLITIRSKRRSSGSEACIAALWCLCCLYLFAQYAWQGAYKHHGMTRCRTPERIRRRELQRTCPPGDWFSDFPGECRPLSTTWPWTIKSSLAILWGVCWMFYDNEDHEIGNFKDYYSWDNAQATVDTSPAQSYPIEDLMLTAMTTTTTTMSESTGRDATATGRSRLSISDFAAATVGRRHSPTFDSAFASGRASDGMHMQAPSEMTAPQAMRTSIRQLAVLGDATICPQGNVSPACHEYNVDVPGISSLRPQQQPYPQISVPDSSGSATALNTQAISYNTRAYTDANTSGQTLSSVQLSPHRSQRLPQSQDRRTVPGVISQTYSLENGLPARVALQPNHYPANIYGSDFPLEYRDNLTETSHQQSAHYLFQRHQHQIQHHHRQHRHPNFDPSPTTNLYSPQSWPRNESSFLNVMPDQVAESNPDLLSPVSMPEDDRATSPDTGPQGGLSPTSGPPASIPSVEVSESRQGTRSPRIFKREEEPPRNAQHRIVCDVPECSGKTFDRKCEWSKHMDKHQRPYKCHRQGCEKLLGFTYSGGLLRHEREVHKLHGGTEKSLYCHHRDCKRHAGSGFTRKENLLEHLRRVHRRSSDETSPTAQLEREDDTSEHGQPSTRREQPQPEPEPAPPPRLVSTKRKWTAFGPATATTDLADSGGESEGSSLRAEIKRLRYEMEEKNRKLQDLEDKVEALSRRSKT